MADTSGSTLLNGKMSASGDGMERAFASMSRANRVGMVTFENEVSVSVEIAAYL